MMRTVTRRAAICLLAALWFAASAPAARLEIRRLPDKAPPGVVEIRGLRAAAFVPGLWSGNRLNLVPDGRSPLIEPRPGPMRNIYAPTIVTEGKGYRVYYGAWDGSETGNDRIYTTTTDAGFTTFGPRSCVIDNGPFQHVCNCSAVRTSGGVTLLATCYPVSNNTNKPGVFTSTDGRVFNGSLPHVPSMKDLVSLTGYVPFEKADINGMNVLLRDDDNWRMYFGDFKNFGKVYRASSKDARHWAYDGSVVDAAMMVNEVKAFRASGKTYYLMLLHQNGDRIAATLSTDSARFPAPATLFRNLGDEDRYIVACGLVTDGKAVLGILYGAGAVKSLDRNRIFARWLQKKVAFQSGGTDLAAGAKAFGPDRIRITLPKDRTAITGTLTLYGEDGLTPLSTLKNVMLRAGETITISRRK